METPVAVRAYLLRGQRTEDPSAAAQFANSDRAETYAMTLLQSGDYAEVVVQTSGTSKVVLQRREVQI